MKYTTINKNYRHGRFFFSIHINMVERRYDWAQGRRILQSDKSSTRSGDKNNSYGRNKSSILMASKFWRMFDIAKRYRSKFLQLVTVLTV